MLTRRRAPAIIVLAVLLLGVGLTVATLRNGAAANPVLYRVPLGPNPRSILLDERAGVAFVPDDTGVSVVDIRRGALLRHVMDAAREDGGVAVDPVSGHAFIVGPDDVTLNMLDTRSGRLLRGIVVYRDRFGVPYEDLHEVTVDATHGRVVVVGDGADALVSVLDSYSGAVLHTVALPGVAGGTAVDTMRQRTFVLAFDSSGNGTINAIDTRGGALLRTLALGAPTSALPASGIAVDDRSGRVVVVDIRGNTRVFDGRTFHLVSSGNVGPLPDTLAIDPRHGYLLASSPISDTVSVLDPRRGVLLRRVSMAAMLSADAAGSGESTPVGAPMAYTFVRGGPHALAVDSPAGRVLLAGTHYFYDPSDHRPLMDGGVIAMLNITTGAAIRFIPAGVDPVAVAVDHASGHLLVVDAGGATPSHDPDPWGWTPDWLRRLLPWLPAPALRVRTASPVLEVIDTTR